MVICLYPVIMIIAILVFVQIIRNKETYLPNCNIYHTKVSEYYLCNLLMLVNVLGFDDMWLVLSLALCYFVIVFFCFFFQFF